MLELLARRIFHVGALGSGAAMKLAVNTVIFGLNGAVAEGLVLAERSGIERSLAYEVLAASAVGAPFVAYKRDAFVRAGDDARRLLAAAGGEGPGADRQPGGRHRPRTAPGRDEPRTDPGR